MNNKTNMPISITFVRHGENIINKNLKNNLLPLTDLGKKQATWGKLILNDDFDVVFSSTSQRTIETANIISGKINPITDKRLLEKGYGNEREDGKESIENTKKRIKSFLNEIYEKYHNQKILIVTHGALMKIIQDIIEKREIQRPTIDNCSIIRYKKRNYNL